MTAIPFICKGLAESCGIHKAVMRHG